MNRSSTPWRHAALAAALALAGLAACAGPDDSEPAIPRQTEPATYLDARGATADEAMIAAAAELGANVSTLTRTDRYGVWNPLRLDDDAPVLDIDPDQLLTPQLDAPFDFSEPWVENAWAVAAAFLVNEWVDSELAWDDTPDNRAAVAARVAQDGYYSEALGGSFLPYLTPDDATRGSFSVHGSWAIDQDYAQWRQRGLSAAAFADVAATETPAERADRHRYTGRLAPAEPAPYAAGQARTYVSTLTLLGIAAGSRTDEIELTAAVAYFRPLAVAGAASPRYERSQSQITFTLAVSGQTSVITGVKAGTTVHSDGAFMTGDEAARLPLLAPSAGAARGGDFVEQGSWRYALPEAAIPDTDGSCAVTAPDGYEGEFTAYDLPAPSVGLPACFQVWTYPTTLTELPEWWINPSTTAWGFERDGAVGVITVDAFEMTDDIHFNILDGRGGRLLADAVVPSGTGPTFAAALAASFRPI
ncbi:MAG: hypothetical protein LBH76_00560 [Propionibacteriaceae bacterium]|jgi:hypothetical protein|nr:hypothetical protein [Propionibacteriaceae bacterium]